MLEEIKTKNELVLLDMEDVKKITGWGRNTINKIMEDKEFPVIKIGRKNQVSLDAFKEYLQHRRIKRGKEE